MTHPTPQTKQSTRSTLYGLLNLLSKLPLAIIQQLAILLASILYVASPKTKKTIARNLLIAFPEWTLAQRQAITKLTFKAQLQSIIEFIKCWGSLPKQNIQLIKQVHNADLFHDAIAANKGLILVTPHFGTWEMMNAWCSQFTSLVIMYKPDDNQAINQFVLDSRSRLNATLVPTDESGVRQIFKALKQGGVTAILPDHLPEPSGGIFSSFFGCPVLTTTLVSRLAYKTNSTVLQMACTRLDDEHGFAIQFEKMHDDIYSADLQRSVDTLNHSMETLIRRAPQHYHWSYKRFKADPLLGQAYYTDDEQALQLVKQAKHAWQNKATET